MDATSQGARSIDRTSRDSSRRWITTWGQAVVQMPAAFGTHRIPAGTLSLRLPLGAGGDGCRLSLSNRHGSEPVRIDSVTITSDNGSVASFAFQSERSVVIPAGESLSSDPLWMPLPAGGAARLTLHLTEGLELTTVNRVATDEWTTVPRDTPESRGRRPRFPFAGADQLSPLPLLAAFDVCVHAGDARGAVLALGDSITAGGWPALASDGGGTFLDAHSFVNAGISGNRLLRAGAGEAGAWFGDAGVSRLAEMLATTSGVDEVIVLMGVNDLLQPGAVAPADEEVTSAELIDGYRELLSVAKQFGVRSIRFCTILPFRGAEGDSVQRERVRCEVNDWIRRLPGFIDTAAALADSDVTRLRKEFDSGDHLHPNEAGQREIAATVRRRRAADDARLELPVLTEPKGCTPEERVAELLERMTVEEKAQQVVGVEPFGLMHVEPPSSEQLDAQLAGGVGHVCMFAMFQHHTLAEHARRVNQVQRHLIENTRLGIPAMFHIEALGGLVAPHFTVFPTGIALAATWDPAAVERMATIVGQQARAIGYAHALSPVMDVARDARWGRVHETYGEDPYLVSEFSVSYTRGLQGDNLRVGAIATGKHFLGFAATEGGQHMAATAVSARERREVHTRPFEAAIRLAGLRSIMNSYSTIDGVPVAANREILTTLLRDELGFDGSVVADYGSVEHLVNRAGVARNLTEAGIQALEAGLDVELPSAAGFGPALAAAVRSGAVSEALLDRAAGRVLRDKIETGVMDDPFVSEDEQELAEVAHRGRELALDLARKSVVLLRNDGTLPAGRKPRRIVIIGPHGDSAVVGHPAYTYVAALGLLGAVDQGEGANMAGLEHSSLSADAREALRAQLGPELEDGFDGYARRHYGSESLAEALRRLSGATVEFVQGCGVLDDEPADFPRAVEAAQGADLVVLALGGRAGWFGSHQTEGEGSDQADIGLPAVQTALARDVAATGAPVVGVIFAGRPIAIPELADVVPTLVYAQYGGQWASTAVAEILLGDVEPTGRLAISLPRHSGQMTIHSGQHLGSGYRRTVTDPHSGYNDMLATPLFPFGHGISFTSFGYGDVKIGSRVIDTTGTIDASVTVANTGDRTGVEVVQFYVSHRAVGVTRPAQQLVAFARVEMKPGERRVVRAVVSLGQLSYVGRTNDIVFEACEVEVQVGSSSVDIRARAVQVVDGATADWSHNRPLLPDVTVSPA